MLVLSRHKDESLIIDEVIVVTVIDIRGDKVRLGIEMPREKSLHRKEVYDSLVRSSKSHEPSESPPPPTPSELDEAVQTLRDATEGLSPEDRIAAQRLLDALRAKLK